MNSSMTFKKGLKDGIPIALGYLSVSFAFGVTAVEMGIPALIALLTSMTNLTSAGQLAGITVIAVFGTLLEVVLTQVVINARYFLMSLSLSQRLDGKFRFIDRVLCAFGVTDEIFAVAVNNKEPITKRYIWGLICLPYFGWAIGTISGALIGNVLPEILVSALSIALFAMFIAIIVPGAMENVKVLPVIIISATASCIIYFVPFFDFVSQGISYIICALVASIIGALLFPIKDGDGNE
ncbi:MAG: AzlC family ABC transporter permease [Clostridia bacterium]|nr:AzlC family ABC transporter permease [Clostridia bacterium]